MAIFNVLDKRRQNEFNPECDAVFEMFDIPGPFNPVTMHYGGNLDDFTEWLSRTTVAEAIRHAEKFYGSVTLFVYDPGSIGNNFGYMLWLHPKLKRDVMIPHTLSRQLYRQ